MKEPNNPLQAKNMGAEDKEDQDKKKRGACDRVLTRVASSAFGDVSVGLKRAAT